MAIEAKVVIEHTMGKGGFGSLLGGIKTGIFGAAAGPSGGGLMAGVGKMAGSMGLLVGVGGVIVQGIGQIVGILTKSSGLLSGAMKGIQKVLLLILKPIGDILGVALMPILYILKPIGVFFNILMKPYIQKAMAAMRAGGAMMKAGDIGGAMGAFTIGATYLLKPFMDMAITVNTELMAMFADLLSNVPGLGAAFVGVGDQMRKSGQLIIDTTTNVLDTGLGNMLAKAEASSGRSFSSIVKSLDDAEVTIGFLSGSIALGIAQPFEDLKTWINTSWGPAFKDTVMKIFEEARSRGLTRPATDAELGYKSYSNLTEAPGFSLGGNYGTRTDIGQKAVEDYINKYFSGYG